MTDARAVVPVAARILPTAMVATVRDVAKSAEVPKQQPSEMERLAAVFADELAQLRTSAREQGYEEGLVRAEAEAASVLDFQKQDLERQAAGVRNALDQRIADLDRLLEDLDAAYQRAVGDLESAAVTIAFAGIANLLGCAETYREMLKDAVSAAVAEFASEEGLRILVSGSDLDLLRTCESKWIGRVGIDQRLAPGSCLIEAGPKSLDASLMLQLESLRKRLLDIYQSRSDEAI